MEQINQYFQWNFPGGTPALAITIAIALALVILSYRFTLASVPRHAKLLLIFFRIIALILIIACLSKPSIVRETQPENTQAKHKVAVVFDQSGSMALKSMFGNSRHDQAKWFYHDKLKKHSDRFDFHLFGFSEQLKPISTLDALPEPEKDQNAPQTHLYDNICLWTEQFIADNFDAVICLTDGIDTSDQPRQNAIVSLDQANLPHAFVPVTTPLPSLPFVEIVKLEASSTAPLGSNLPANIMVQTAGLSSNQPLTLTVESENKQIYSQNIDHFDKITSSQSISFHVPVTSDKTHKYTALIKSGTETLASANWTVQGLREQKPKILLYTGTLDWGIRHLRGTFDRADNAELHVMFHPMALTSGTDGSTGIRFNSGMSFPGKTQLDTFDVVILMNINRDQITKKILSDLQNFVTQGGGLLFINANPAAANQLADSSFGKLLPVTFNSAPPPDLRIDQATKSFSDTIKVRFNGSSSALARLDPSFSNYQQKRHNAPPLRTFTLTSEGANSPIFNFAIENQTLNNQLLPQFQDAASVNSAKPAANVLAVFPAKSSNKPPNILLATQPFGSGRTAILATDSLWRWRLSLDADSYAFDKFWRQLISYLGAAKQRQPAWVLNSVIHRPNQPVEIRFNLPHTIGYKMRDMVFTANSTDEQITLPFTLTETKNQYRTTLMLKPKAAYSLIAKHKQSGKIIAEAFVSAQPGQAGLELRTLKPDPIGLATLAAASRGVTVDIKQDFDWKNWLPGPKPLPPVITQHPIWHSPYLFAALLFIVIIELILRRRYRMV